MPVEIKELVIRTVVNDATNQQPEEGNVESAGPPVVSHGGSEAMVQECVRQVMRILARNKER